MNLEGRLQRLRRAVIPPCPDELAWIAKLAERFGVTALAACASGLRRALGALLRRPRLHRRSASARRCPSELPRSRCPQPPTPAKRRGQGHGPSPDHLPAALLGPGRRTRVRAPVPAARSGGRALGRGRSEARRRARRRRQRPLQRHLGRASRAREQDARRRRRPSGRRACPGPRHARGGRDMSRASRAACASLGAASGGGGGRLAGREPTPARGPHERALVDRPDQGGRDHQPAARHVRVHDLGRAEAARPHAAALRAQPGRPVRAPPADRRPRQADPQGELLPADRRRAPLHRSAGDLGRHRPGGVRRHPLRGGLARLGATTSRARSSTSRSR